MIRFQDSFPVLADHGKTGRLLLLSVMIPVISACEITPSSSSPSTVAQPPLAQIRQQVPDHPPQGRDPVMERGAGFMAVLMQYKQRLEEDPKDKEALLFLGNANYDIARFEQAGEYYKRYLELDPTHAAVRTDLATTYYNTQDLDSSIRELRTVLAQAPDHAAALFNLGLMLARDKQDRPGAIKTWEALLRAHPDYPRAVEVRREIEELKKKS